MNKKNKMTLAFPAFLLMALLIFSSCSEKIMNLPDKDVTVAVNASVGSIGEADEFARFVLIVTGPGIDPPIVKELDMIERFIIGDVTVPVGERRRFVLTIYDDLERLVYRGERTVNLLPGVLLELEIPMFPQVPTVKLSPRYVAVPMGFLVYVDVKVYNIPNLNSIDILLNHNYWWVDTAYLGSELSPNDVALIQIPSDIDAFRISHRNPSGTFVDDSGYANLATIQYYTYEDVSGDTLSLPINMNLYSIWLNSGDSVAVADVLVEGCDVDAFRLSSISAAFWPMNEYANDTVFDNSPNGLNGIGYNTGLDEWSYVYARTFDGVSSYVEVPDNNALDLTSVITIAMWVKVDPTENSGTLISKRAPDGDINYLIRYTGPGPTIENLTFVFGPVPGNVYRIPVNFQDGWWHHIAFAFRFGEPSSATWLVDGKIIEGNWIYGDGTPIPINNDGDLQMGRELAEADGGYFHGSIDEVLILNIHLEPAYLEQLYQPPM